MTARLSAWDMEDFVAWEFHDLVAADYAGACLAPCYEDDGHVESGPHLTQVGFCRLPARHAGRCSPGDEDEDEEPDGDRCPRCESPNLRYGRNLTGCSDCGWHEED